MTKIEPPLVEGEWVVAERRSGPFKGATSTVRAEGPVWIDEDGDSRIGIQCLHDGVWTILERRPPKPDWADADAILVEWESGVRVVELVTDKMISYVKQQLIPTGRIKSIKGLYLRDDS